MFEHITGGGGQGDEGREGLNVFPKPPPPTPSRSTTTKAFKDV